MRPKTIVSTRFCETCNAEIVRRYDEGAKRYSKRRFCSRSCEAKRPDRPHPVGPRINKPRLRSRVMRELYFVGRLKQHELGRMFGLRQSSVSRIISGQVWQ